MRLFTFWGPRRAQIQIIAQSEADAIACHAGMMRPGGELTLDGWKLMSIHPVTFPLVSHLHIPREDEPVLVAGSHLLGGEHE